MADPSSSSSRSASVIRSLQGKLRQLLADLGGFSPRPEALLPLSALAVRENEVREAAGFLEQDGLGPSAKRLLCHWEQFLLRVTDVMLASGDNPAYQPSEDELDRLLGTVAGFESFLTELATEVEPRGGTLQESITREEADAVARKLAERDPTFKSGTAVQWAGAIERESGKDCSATTVKETDFWNNVMEESGRKRGKGRARALSFTKEVQSMVVDNRQVGPLKTLVAAEEEENAIQAVMSSSLPDTERTAIIEKVKNGEMTPAAAKEVARLAAEQQAEHEPSSLDCVRQKVRYHKQT